MAVSNRPGIPSPRKQTTALKPPAAATPSRVPPAAPRPTQQFEAKPKPRPAAPSPQAVAEAAYFLWLQRGGNEVDNWLEAEATLRAKAELGQFS